MKKSIIIYSSLLICSKLLANVPVVNASELSWVDEQVEAIKPARKGVKESSINSLQNPFIFLKSTKSENSNSKSSKAHTEPKAINKATNSTQNTEEQTTKKEKFSLEAIINSSALIDGKWYKEGQIVYGYTLTKVNAKNVLLQKNKKSIMLTTQSNHKNLKFNNN